MLNDLAARANWADNWVRGVLVSMFTPSPNLSDIDAAARHLYQLVQQAVVTNDPAMYDAISSDFQWFMLTCLPRHNLLF